MSPRTEKSDAARIAAQERARKAAEQAARDEAARKAQAASATKNPDADRKAAQIEKMVSAAQAQKGDAYDFGHEVNLDDKNPNTFDCSELVEWATHQAGGKIPDGSGAQRGATVPITVEEALHTRGALLFHEGHVAISLGDGRTIEAANHKAGVIETSATNRSDKFTSAGLIPDFLEGYPKMKDLSPAKLAELKAKAGSDRPPSTGGSSGSSGGGADVADAGGGGGLSGITTNAQPDKVDESSYQSPASSRTTGDLSGVLNDSMNFNDLMGLLGGSMQALLSMNPAQFQTPQEMQKALQKLPDNQLKQVVGQAMQKAEAAGMIPPGSAAQMTEQVVAAVKSGDSFQAAASSAAPVSLPTSPSVSAAPPSMAALPGIATISGASAAVAAGHGPRA